MTAAWINQFEAQLDQLERAAHQPDVLLSQLMPQATSALAVLANTSSLRTWLVRPEQIERLRADGTTECVPPNSEPSVQQAAARGFLFADLDHQRALYMPVQLGQSLTFVLALDHTTLIAPQDSVLQGAQAVAGVLSTWVSRHLLSRYEHQLQQQVQLVAVITSLQASQTASQTASVVAQDGAAVLNHCRTSVLLRRDERFRLEAISGVDRPQREAEVVRALQNLADQHSETQTWQTLDSADEDSAEKDSTGAVTTAIDVLRRTGTQQLRIVSLTPDVVMVVEQFQDCSLPEDSVLRQLAAAAEPVFRRLMSRRAPWLSRWLTTGRQRGLAAMMAVAALLTFVPADFEIEVPGRVMAANLRHIFAPDNGTIDEVMFQNETAVAAGQILLKMSNPDLELELRRIQGEIDTVTAKLAAARAGRLTSTDGRFSGDEQQLEKQLENLNSQQKLVQEQAAALDIQAPVAGMAFRRDPQQDLHARPVQRGQRLLDLVPNDAQWQLDLAIPARLLNYVTDYRHQHQQPARVRYLLRSAPDRDWTTRLSIVENAVEAENGTLACRGIAKLAEVPDVELRPGTSVVARLYCGRRSLGFVWFRELWEFWQQVQFAWF